MAAFIGTQIRLVFSATNELNMFKSKRAVLHLPRLLPSKLQIQSQALYSPTILSSLQVEMRTLDIRIAFQLEAFLRNLILDAKQVFELLSLIKRDESSLSPEKMERILVALRAELLELTGNTKSARRKKEVGFFVDPSLFPTFPSIPSLLQNIINQVRSLQNFRSHHPS